MNLTHIFVGISVFFLVSKTLELVMGSRKTAPGFMRGQGNQGIKRSILEAVRIVSRNGLNQAILRSRGYRQHLDVMLMRSGYPFEWKADDLLLSKEFSVVTALLLIWAAGLIPLILDGGTIVEWILAAVIAFYLPDLLLKIRQRARKDEMQRQLPTFVDLMALAVDGGLDFTVAIERICEKMRRGALRQELFVLLQESRLGAARKEILMRWANRTGLSDAQSLASLVVQSEEMGTPLAAVLRSYAEDMRVRRILRAEEIAGKIPVKILFPMMVFFFPIVFAIMLGPIALQFSQGAK